MRNTLRLLLKQKYKLVLGELSIERLISKIKTGQRLIMVTGRSLETGKKKKEKICVN